MKKVLVALATLCITADLFAPLSAREAVRPGLRPERPWSKEQYAEVADPSLVGIAEEAAVDTYCIVWYNFEVMHWQGWSRLDFTAQADTLFFHVDDFVGAGGDHGMLHPISGAKSMWCGARPNPADPYMCGWATAPGYGNNWNQLLRTPPITMTGWVTFSYSIAFDSELDHDFIRVEYDDLEHGWTALASYSGSGSAFETLGIPLRQTHTKLLFHFTSDGSWSDQDGLWNTDGACIVDNITVSDEASYHDFQDFESASVGAHRAGIWIADKGVAYGKCSGLKSNLADRDPCGDNYGTQIVFFLSSGPRPAPGYPGLYETPFCKGSGGTEAPCQHEVVYSPVIDLTKYSTACNRFQNGTIPPGDLPQLGGTLLRFTVYPDLPLPNLVFYEWYVRNIDETGCPGQWKTDNTIYYYRGWGDAQYYFFGYDVSRFVTEDKVQVAVGVVDMCDAWYLVNGDCAEHTPAPWFDNVRLYRYKTSGPHWSYRDFDLFQDNFPTDAYYGPPWNWVRADAANDIRPNNVAGIDPGDSIVVDCASPMGGGIDTLPDGSPAVYMHVLAHWIGAGAPPLGAGINGSQLQGSVGQWLSTDGGGWDIIQGDYARTSAGVTEGKYMFDLNDSLFVPGYIIEYYFTAVDNAAVESALPKWARSTGPYFEFTCLPTGTSRVLYVDDFSGRGSFLGAAEDYWRGPLNMLPVSGGGRYDTYDVNGPSSAVSNGPGSRADAALMRYQYDVVIWDSGDLQSCTVSDGSTNSDKSNDCQLLVDWVYTAEHPCGLWVCGDDVAYDLTETDGLSAPALALMSTWCGVDYVTASYFSLTGGFLGGGEMTPLITGDAAGIFYHGGYPDRFYLYGGCPTVNQFDCLEKTANGAYALDYPSFEALNYYAGIQSVSTNAMDETIRTMWFGFSLMYIRDDAPAQSPIDRFEIVHDVLTWMQQSTYTGVENPPVPGAWALTQNYPNPFNPRTTIRYDMKEKGLVTVKVFNVAGQLVCTLVSEVKEAGSYTAVWDGRNNLGADVASGIYFYKMETAGFGATKKMVVLR